MLLNNTMSEIGASNRNQMIDVTVVGTILVIGLAAVWMLFSINLSGEQNTAGGEPIGAQQLAFEEFTGVRLVHVAVTGGGGLMDIRYQILDPDKAVVVHDDENPLTIIHEQTGANLYFTLHEHNDDSFRPAILYSQILMNSAGIVQPGDYVTLEVGEVRLEHLKVQ
jgi:hypothetical protein